METRYKRILDDLLNYYNYNHIGKDEIVIDIKENIYTSFKDEFMTVDVYESLIEDEEYKNLKSDMNFTLEEMQERYISDKEEERFLNMFEDSDIYKGIDKEIHDFFKHNGYDCYNDRIYPSFKNGIKNLHGTEEAFVITKVATLKKTQLDLLGDLVRKEFNVKELERRVEKIIELDSDVEKISNNIDSFNALSDNEIFTWRVSHDEFKREGVDFKIRKISNNKIRVLSLECIKYGPRFKEYLYLYE